MNHRFPITTATAQHGLFQSLLDNEFPAQVYHWQEQPLDLQQEQASFFGFVHQGTATLTTAQGCFTLKAGMYFCVPEAVHIEGDGHGLVVEQRNFVGFFQLGGPIEAAGRLRYIDGCTDSLLLSPPVLGDPCFNLLHIPPHTFQSQHTHPSFRVGMIVQGHGVCVTPEGELPLQPGLSFVIPTDQMHSFTTQEEALLIVAYHPDSDFGPTHENHPMINKTLLPQS